MIRKKLDNGSKNLAYTFCNFGLMFFMRSDWIAFTIENRIFKNKNRKDKKH